MVVRMNTFLLWQGRECLAGEEVDLPGPVAEAYLRTGQAERVETTSPLECAMLPAAQPRGKHVRNAATRT